MTPAGDFQTDRGILREALGNDPVLGQVAPKFRQGLEGSAQATAIEKGKRFVKEDELIVTRQPCHQFLGQTEPQGQHDLALGAV